MHPRHLTSLNNQAQHVRIGEDISNLISQNRLLSRLLSLCHLSIIRSLSPLHPISTLEEQSAWMNNRVWITNAPWSPSVWSRHPCLWERLIGCSCFWSSQPRRRKIWNIKKSLWSVNSSLNRFFQNWKKQKLKYINIRENSLYLDNYSFTRVWWM